ncbi:MAG TPA: signal recognition particle-docking protein FtsY [Fimbriimonadales bacterium]|nr:signal recognition particle-docking protein FtsY [Fimbriimonadales bacterium]
MRVGIFKSLRNRIDRLFGRGVIDEELFADLETALIQSDVGAGVAAKIMEEVRGRARREQLEAPNQIREAIQTAVAARLRAEESALATAPFGPTVYLFLGVNGAGKTTTIAKLAHHFKDQGKTVIVAAGDTFRAAAIEQLEIWAGRVGVGIVRGQPGGDPGAVIFDAITAAKARGIDYVLADTAGRQHTKENLMQELQKVVKVAEKALGRLPHEVLLVLDGNTGQNAIRQAEEFSKAAGVTGAVITKLDGTAKGGAVIGVSDQLGIPIKLIGIGERPADLVPFRAADFARDLVE